MAESRLYTEEYTARRPSGQAVVGVRCPFCDVATEALRSTLAHPGKRCDCGAVHRSGGPVPGGQTTRDH